MNSISAGAKFELERIGEKILREANEDTKRLDWLDETQALCDDGDGAPFYQEWKVTASENYRGIREAIDAAMKKSK